MICFKKNVISIQQGQGSSFYVNLPSESAPSGPTTGNYEEPFDLTGATEIIASFPGISGSPVNEKLSLSQVSISGAAGAGKILVPYSALDSLNMLPNPVVTQNQDLQVIVTKSGVAQVETLSLAAGPVAGTTYSVTINGVLFSYTAVTGDTTLIMMTALLAALNTYIAAAAALSPPAPFNLSGVVAGSGNAATLALTSTFAGLPFTIAQSGLTLVHTTANAGTIAVFLFKFALNIQPQSYVIT